MSGLHDHLKQLLPIPFASLPTSDDGLSTFIRDAVSHCQALVDSVPPPPSEANTNPSSTPSAASTGSEVQTSSSVATDASDTVTAPDPKAWGKPVKLNAKDNPHAITVYKMAAADRRGAWFARRSVHAGLGFARWKRCLDSEFDESLAAEDEVGSGNVRGIGGEHTLVNKSFEGVGELKVMRLTAQFPGPSSPRDFVELLISSTTHPSDQDKERGSSGERKPRQYLLISRPVEHPDAGAKSGFVRGQYESVEFIREIPVRKTKTVSTADLPATAKGKVQESDGDKETTKQEDTDLVEAKNGTISVADAQATIEANVANGETMPKSGQKGDTVEVPVDGDGDLSPHPIEWIMITRSDPGGSVPKFMVERGTPSAIVSDADKFLKWAVKQEMPVMQEEAGPDIGRAEPVVTSSSSTKDTTSATAAARHAHASSLTRTQTAVSTSSDSDSDSFVSADSGDDGPGGVLSPRGSTLSTSFGIDKFSRREAELDKKLEARKAQEAAKTEERKSRHANSESKMKKDDDRHERKLREADNWYAKEKEKIQSQRAKEERKLAARKKKEKEKMEAGDLRPQLESLKKENANLRAEVERLTASLTEEHAKLRAETEKLNVAKE